MGYVIGTWTRVVPLCRDTPRLTEDKIFSADISMVEGGHMKIGLCINIPDLTTEIALPDEGCVFTHPIISKIQNSERFHGRYNLWANNGMLRMQRVDVRNEAEGPIYEAPLEDIYDISRAKAKIVVLNNERTEVLRIEDWTYWGQGKFFKSFQITSSGGMILVYNKFPDDNTTEAVYKNMDELMLHYNNDITPEALGLIIAAFSIKTPEHIELALSKILPNFATCDEDFYPEMLRTRKEIFV